MSPIVSDFIYAAAPARVLFGAGRVRQLSAELDRPGAARALLACTRSGKERYRSVIDALGPRCVHVFDNAQPHCPEDVADAALAAFDTTAADAVVTIGGGSTIGLGKVIASCRRAPSVAVPTTLSGSEMTALYGMKIGQKKSTCSDPAAKARSVIYDPDLIVTLPKHEIATTGMNCLAHCIEALYPAEPNPIARVLALDAISVLARSLPRAIAADDAGSRAGALYGGFIGGLLVSMVGIGLHHKICHALGGHFDLPHGETNSVILPYILAFNAPAMPLVVADLARAFEAEDAAAALFALAGRIGVPTNLRQLGLRRSDLRQIAAEVVVKGMHNPRPITVDSVTALLDAAWEGCQPSRSRLAR
jgi:maleylacetate reductase